MKIVILNTSERTGGAAVAAGRLGKALGQAGIQVDKLVRENSWLNMDEFISHYGTLEEVVEHKDDIYYYPDCETRRMPEEKSN